eukprot:scaffold9607_cov158-Alexandrium_tamarense.AAC.2
MYIPRSLSAPDALIAVLVASLLQFKQYSRRREQQRKSNEPAKKAHASARQKPAFSLVHELLFTRLSVMASPFTDMASNLGAQMVDLKSEEELDNLNYTRAAGSSNNKKKGAPEKLMEVRSRRIKFGELLLNPYYPALETVLNIALALLMGLISRWMFGLFRSLRLSLGGMFISGGRGTCCSPYRGEDDEGSRLPGAFERLLACVLVKREGDEAGTFLLSVLLLSLIVGAVKLAWIVSLPSASTKEENDTEITKTKSKGDEYKPKRINKTKVRCFFAGVLNFFSALWLFHTPALLRQFGLAGLTEAAEEWSARVLLFGNMVGVVTLQPLDSLEKPSSQIQTLASLFLVLLSLLWGYVAAGMMLPIEETARNASHVLSPASKKQQKKKLQPTEMFELINTRVMLVIMSLAPFLIMSTYLAESRFAESLKHQTKSSGVKQYLQNSGLFVRFGFSWCFIFAALYCCRSLLQTYLDQAATVSSAMALYKEATKAVDASAGKGSRNKRNATTSTTSQHAKQDPFSDRYGKIVLTAGRVVAFPAFIFALLAFGHLRGGDGYIHPGVGYKSQPRDSPRMVGIKGLLPPYGGQYIMWIAKNNAQTEMGAGDALIQAAALSQSSWEPTPLRDAAHRKLVGVLGRQVFCNPPDVRSVKSMGRHVNFLVGNDASVLTVTAMTGRELIDRAPVLPATAVDFALGRVPGSTWGNDSCTAESTESKECRASSPSFKNVLSSLISHNILTPTVVFPIVEAIAFLSSVWWTYWYSVKTAVFMIKIRGASGMRIMA